uniref:Uncharacterized protein n=1 Tax=Anguilla anguilla TaxID=7936 RepID=A0A0E9UBR4_ANGAN
MNFDICLFFKYFLFFIYIISKYYLQ